TDAEWAEVLKACEGGRFVVQRRVVPNAEPVIDPNTREVVDWSAIWGVFLTPQGYGGTCIRALPADGGAVIGHGASTTTKLATVFSYA
ncbi:MAG TPA: hypothetical protein VF364_08135, partial [Candidatus Limnocylindria bacterium]